MLRTVVATSVFALACGSKTEKPDTPPGAGPGYTPLVANGLRAIASDCKLSKSGVSEQHRCIGVKGVVQVAVAADKMAELSIKLRAMIFAEAKGHLTHALRPVVGQPGVEELIGKLEKMKTGERIDLTIGAAKIGVAAEGTSQLAPEFNVTIRW